MILHDASHANTVVIGLGNPVLSDDTMGLVVVKELKKKYSSVFPQTAFRENYSGGFDLLYDLIGYTHAIIIDSITTKMAEPGFCHEFKLEDFAAVTRTRLIDSHGLNLPGVLDAGKKCGYYMPEDIAIFGVEGAEYSLLSEKPTLQVLGSLTEILEKIVKKLYTWNCHSLETAK